MRGKKIIFAVGALLLTASMGMFGGLSAYAQDADQGIDLEAALAERTLGSADAPVTIYAYESFSCGHCAAFHAEIYDDLKAQYIDTGKVRFVYRDYPLNLPALLASIIARCADPQRFFGLATVLFRNQNDWLGAPNPNFELGRIGRLAGMDSARMESCVNNVELREGIEAIKAGGQDEFGISTTPSFVINGSLYQGEQTLAQFAEAIDPLVEAAE